MLQHFDHLNEENVQQVHEMKLSSKPLFLSLLAGEMCCFSVYTGLSDYLEEIGEKISSLRDYCLRCFQRWSREMSWTKENLYGEVDDEELLGRVTRGKDHSACLTGHYNLSLRNSNISCLVKPSYCIVQYIIFTCIFLLLFTVPE
jgi:hypothetical protein